MFPQKLRPLSFDNWAESANHCQSAHVAMTARALDCQQRAGLARQRGHEAWEPAICPAQEAPVKTHRPPLKPLGAAGIRVSIRPAEFHGLSGATRGEEGCMDSLGCYSGAVFAKTAREGLSTDPL
jgi:hypothetical protein